MEKIITDKQRIEEVLTRGVEGVFVKEELKANLLSGKQLRIKLGIDPTGPKIHLGRAITLRKLREFQKLGHQVVFIVGDFTAQVGDASDKSDKRPMLTKAQIDENLKDYKTQVAKILDISKTEFVHNSDWLSKLSFEELVKLSECFTVQQMLARRNFKDRFEAEKEISLREFLYPIMQGYDSVAIKADVEIGGFDQLFNLKAGRVLQEYYGMPKQAVFTTTMLEGTDGNKMSTSQGNIISIVDEPFDMFGKIMSLRDELIIKYYTLCTDISLDEIKNIETEIKNGLNPKDAKMKLAQEIVTLYHNEKAATLARNSFIETFQKGGVPEDVTVYNANIDEELAAVLVREGVVASKSEWRRLVESNAITKEDDTIISDPKHKVENAVYKIGKKRFAKIHISSNE